MSKPKTIFLKDYQPPQFFIDRIHLFVDLYEGVTRVTAKSQVRRNKSIGSGDEPLVLHGEELKFVSAAVNGKEARVDEGDSNLTVYDVPDEFELVIANDIFPEKNKALEGLYRSASGMYCTQCEAEGFRRITYFVDRPDNMALYKTTITADKTKYPVLLSNGNLIDSKDIEGGRHEVTWEDPFKKPSYLFALVGGDLDVLKDQYTTQSGRVVDLYLYTDKGRADRARWGIECLKKSMKWDEDTYGLEYDLDIYMIVAVDDFNMGAMENKGLNIFNSVCALANEETATDMSFERVDGIIAHEYFHNWTGNRVTCRDWFQLSLKEGLTVYRDQEYSGDQTSKVVQRIGDVASLRAGQFLEDAGPSAHPVRPESCISVDNFYTATVYSKGAEVIRMIEQIVGKDGFRKGMDLYFELFDGQAVTTEDFVYAMEKANSVDLTQFKNWYSQSGTPVVDVTVEKDFGNNKVSLKFKQTCPPTPGQDKKEPFHIPIRMGLVSAQEERDLAFKWNSEETEEIVFNLKGAEETIVLEDVSEDFVPSLLRGFSAPVKLNVDLTDQELAVLMEKDSDLFNRWEACQVLAKKSILNLYNQPTDEFTLSPSDEVFLNAFSGTLSQWEKDPRFVNLLLNLPSSTYIEQFLSVVDPIRLESVYKFLSQKIGGRYYEQFKELFKASGKKVEDSRSQLAVGLRDLKRISLYYLTSVGEQESFDMAKSVYENASNMTETMIALGCLAERKTPLREILLKDFYDKWHSDSIIMDSWLRLKGRAPGQEGLEFVKNVETFPVFSKDNPNNVSSVFLRGFAYGNPVFHDPSGEGYKLLADMILKVDQQNPQLGARLCEPFNTWNKLVSPQKEMMKSQIDRIMSAENLSKNSFEILSKAQALK